MIHIVVQIIFFCFLNSQTLKQIEEAKKYMEKNSISVDQARNLARQKGYSDKQIDKVLDNNLDKKRSLNSQESLPSTNDKPENPLIIKESNDIQQQSWEKSNQTILNETEVENEIKETIDLKRNITTLDYFGYNTFKEDPSLFLASSVGAVDPNYIIGPSDEIIVMLWGETQFRQVLTVDREGFVFIPEVGQVFVNGLNLSLLESKFFKVLSQSYASLNPYSGDPTTFLDISLGNLRPLRIQVLGEVLKPGAHTVSPSTTLFSSLYYFNGPSKLGSLRDIRLIRGGKQITSIDFYNYLMTGKKIKDFKLQLDDVVFIPKRMKTISIKGEVNRPGIYELKEEESLSDLIEFAGGLKVSAYLDRAQIDRIVPFNQRRTLRMDRMITDVDLGQILLTEASFKLQDGDSIQVYSISDSRSNIVSIEGAVSRPGDYEIIESMSLGDLIEKADGLLGDAYLARADIVRINEDFTEKLIKLDLGKALDQNTENNVQIKPFDKVIVYGTSEMISDDFVSVSGYAKNPGLYLLQENMTLYDLIFKSGGFLDEKVKSKAYLNRAELVTTNELNNKKIIPFNLGEVINNKNIASRLLKSGDEVRIYSVDEVKGEKRFITVLGSVKKPGKYELFEENMMLRDLIFMAGGLEDKDFKSKIFLNRADLIRSDYNGLNKEIISFNLGELIESENSPENIKLQSNDVIKIYPLNFFEKIKPLYIDGDIQFPGAYELKKNMILTDLIIEAGGFSGTSYIYEIEVARIDTNKIDGSLNLIKFNINEKFITKDISNYTVKDKFILEPFDNVYVRKAENYLKQRKVTIVGEVKNPGIYSISKPNEKISDVINRAGGLNNNALLNGSVFIRQGKVINLDIEKIVKRPKNKQNITIDDGDSLFIAPKPNIISIVGEVSSPGFYAFSEGLKLESVIKRAGGFTKNADLNSVFIEYPNGSSKKYHKWFVNPKVLDSSIIHVGKLPEEEPFDRTAYLKDLTSIIVNFAQAIYIISVSSR